MFKYLNVTAISSVGIQTQSHIVRAQHVIH